MSAIPEVTVQVAGLNGTGNPPTSADAVQREPAAYDIAAFRKSWESAQTVNSGQDAPAQPVTPTESEGLRAVFSTLKTLNGRAETLEAKADLFTSGAQDMSPGDMLMLTVQSHEFLFHCELTANVANRTSDGIQQLFRQQS